jgi:hypothetical protein
MQGTYAHLLQAQQAGSRSAIARPVQQLRRDGNEKTLPHREHAPRETRSRSDDAGVFAPPAVITPAFPAFISNLFRPSREARRFACGTYAIRESRPTRRPVASHRAVRVSRLRRMPFRGLGFPHFSFNSTTRGLVICEKHKTAHALRNSSHENSSCRVGRR